MPTGLSTFVRPALLALMAATALAAISGSPRTFDADPVGRPPAGFAFHAVRYSSAPRWLVQREGTNGFLAHGGEASGHTGFDLAVHGLSEFVVSFPASPVDLAPVPERRRAPVRVLTRKETGDIDSFRVRSSGFVVLGS